MEFISTGTHIPMLLFCAKYAQTRIVELGMGFYSTYLLNMGARYGNTVLSFENNPEWYNKFKHLEIPFFHTMKLVDNYDKALNDDSEWNMVFVDNAPAERRIVDIQRFKERANLILVHDTEDKVYAFDKITNNFKFVFIFKWLKPWTTAFSRHNLCSLFKQFNNNNNEMYWLGSRIPNE